MWADEDSRGVERVVGAEAFAGLLAAFGVLLRAPPDLDPVRRPRIDGGNIVFSIWPVHVKR